MPAIECAYPFSCQKTVPAARTKTPLRSIFPAHSARTHHARKRIRHTHIVYSKAGQTHDTAAAESCRVCEVPPPLQDGYSPRHPLAEIHPKQSPQAV